MCRTLQTIVTMLLMPALFTTLLMMCAVTANATSAGLGYVNADDRIDAADALLALQHSVNLVTLSEEQFQCADVNADGTVDAADALLILQHSVGLIDRFPGEKNTDVNPWTGKEAYAQEKAAYDYDGIITTYQNGGGYDEKYDVYSDSVMVYADNVHGSDSLLRSWTENGRGRTIDMMLSANRAVNQSEYINQYGGNYDYELQRVASGERIEPDGVPYNIPTENFINYKWEIIKHHCENYPIRMIALEEPEIWRSCGYSQAFKDEWKAYYNEDWQDQNSSAEAMYKSCKLKVHLWERFLSTLIRRTKEAFPEVKIVVATHSVLSYNAIGIIAGVSHYSALEGMEGLIGQTWSNTVAVPMSYNGQNVTRRFEAGYIGYASYVDTVNDDQMLFTLSDPYADYANASWEYYEDTYKKTLVAQLLQQDVFRYEETLWLNRSFTASVPSEYRTLQMGVFNTLPKMAGKASTLYAGTPGISVGISDTLSWQYNNGAYMACNNTNQGFYGLTLPLLEKGLPISITSLDCVKTKADLEGVKLLVVSYDIMKPISEETNRAIADWVKDGGVLLYAGGSDAYSTEVSTEWWAKQNTTPTAHLFEQLGLDVAISNYEYMDLMEWKGSSGYGSSFADSFVMGTGFTDCYSGSGIKPLIVCSDDILGFEAQVGRGRVLAVGLPSTTYSAEGGAQKIVDLVRYAVKYTDVDYVESNLLAIRRGDFLAAETLAEGETLTGHFVDIFDSRLPVLTEKVMPADSSALLLDISELLESNIPRFAHAGGTMQGEVSETAEKTAYSLYGPKGSITSARLLGNGKYPQNVMVTDANGQRYGAAIALWDNDTDSLLVQIDHNSVDVLTVEVIWGDTPVQTTPDYTLQTVTVKTNETDEDAEFLFEDRGTATKAFRHCEYDGTLTYRVDLGKYDSAYVTMDIFYNYVVEVSNDNQTWTKVYDYRDVSDQYIEKNNNRVNAVVFSPDDKAKTMYIRLSNTDPTKAYGAGIRSFSVKYHQLTAQS